MNYKGLIKNDREVMATLLTLITTEYKRCIITDEDISAIFLSYEYNYPNKNNLREDLKECIESHIKYLLEERGYV